MPQLSGKQLYDAGVRVFLVLDFDGVLNAVFDKGTFPKECFGQLGNFKQAAKTDHGLTAR